jgi:hypothetical protein
MVVAPIVAKVQSSSCIPYEECYAVFGGIGWGLLSGGVVMSLTIAVLAIRRRVGAFFGAGAALGVLALLAAAYWAWVGWAQPLLLLGAVAFAVGALLQHCHHPETAETGRWRRPSRTAVLITAGVIVVGALPAVGKLARVWSEQRRIEAVVARPLQTDLNGRWPHSVQSWDSGFEYSLLGRPSDGTRIADVSVTVRRGVPDQAPCTGFTERGQGPVRVTGCAEIEPGRWTGHGTHGEQLYFVHDGAGQWAYVRSETTGDADSRSRRAAEVAKSLEPRSAFPLAAAATGCGFCEWLG